MATLPPRRNPTPTKISKQHLTPLQVLLQMGFPKHRAEKALAATGYRGVQLASDWLLAHVNDPLLDDNSPRDYILYACPTGPFYSNCKSFGKIFSIVWLECSYNIEGICTAPDEDVLHLAQGLKSVMDRQGATLNEPLKLETYTSPNFMGFFCCRRTCRLSKKNSNAICERSIKCHSNAYLGKLFLMMLNPVVISDTYEHFDALTACFPWCTTTTARCIPREVDLNQQHFIIIIGFTAINVEPHVKSLHLSLAYKFPNSHFTNLKSLVDELDPNVACSWEVRLYSRDPRINSKQVHKVIHTYSPTESDELDLRSGDYVYISSEALSNSPDGWVEGTSWLTGLSGLLPEKTKNSPQKTDQVQMVGKEHSVLNNDEIKMPRLPDDHNYDEIEKANTNSENLYANIVHFKKSENTEDEVGDALKEQNIDIHFAYCSPSFRCIQTCDAFLQGLNKRDKVKIKIEPGLFEWLVWYPECLPDWFTVEELKNAGYNIDENYQPFINEKDLKESKENCEQFYLRSAFCAVSANPMGNILFVGHAATLDTCAHELLGRRTRLANDMTKLIQKVPYCSLIQMTCQQDKWEIVEPPCYPITHSANQRFDWKILLN
ncbi:hypothetical protein NQ314_020032 [Rhamnusium bicolor]|uniref:Ecdysteroid-phosphate phosphatase n=1 Tax=Rhamnusium bicolor TaxID=1586634 RepID=A0AAV8WMK8_9CUCU|nr:hypothetical protein NQ314_020032 [Rhamnusium bicolor]